MADMRPHDPALDAARSVVSNLEVPAMTAARDLRVGAAAAREALAPIREEMERLSAVADQLGEYGSPTESAMADGMFEVLRDLAEHVYTTEEMNDE